MTLFRACFLMLTAAMLWPTQTAQAELWLPNIFTDHMVLQREQENRVWGWDDPGTQVTVTLGEHSASAKANGEGRWEVKLPAHKVGGPHQMTIQGTSKKTIKDILFGEVWICSGQSNMGWNVNGSFDADLEKLTAKFPNIRLISVPQVGTQEAQNNFNGKWELCTPETVANFTAVGYFFGRQLHQTLDVPIGLIDNAWGGSAAEAWVERSELESDPRFEKLMARWKQTEDNYDWEAITTRYKAQVEKWKAAVEKAKAEGKPVPNRPRGPRNQMTGNHRPANIYNGVLHPTIGYGIKGVVWYQGESNAGRAYQYRELFPKMITHWREKWGQGDFSFYWVQLADFLSEDPQVGESSWAELREAQTMTMKLPNTGEAVIIRLGEGRDIHPRDKQNVAMRLARWALAKDYGYNIPFQSPTFKSMEVKGGKVHAHFDHVHGGLYAFDTQEVVGFTIAGEDKVWHAAKGRIVDKDTVEVWSDEVKAPVAIRYAWANNPICNLTTKSENLFATPFRSDSWKGVTEGNE